MVSLSKGQKISLTKDNPGLKHILVGLGWDTNKYDGGEQFDLDAAAFQLAGGRVREEKDFIFYANLSSATGSVVHSGDNLTGEGDGDDEVLHVDLTKVDGNVERIEFTATIYDAEKRKQTFGMVSNAYIRLVNEDTGAELARYDLGEDASVETALKFAALYRHGAEWKFEAIGAGYTGGLAALCKEYGIDAQ